MANPEHLAILKQGVEEWNAWRDEHANVTPDLSDAKLIRADLCRADLRRATLVVANLREVDLHEADLLEADLSGAILTEANISGTNLSRATLSDVDLGGARLNQAHLSGTDLSGAQLSGAILSGANLRGANLSQANLSGAELAGARAGETIFANVDLSGATGLETVVHRGPSTIGIDTIYKSGGKIPEVFLRGCGVPEEFIAYIGSMVGRPIEYYSCFISYSAKDQEFADRLYADLQAKGVRCWFAPHDIKGGRKIHEQIDEAIRLHDKLLLILSDHSMTSEWVKTELAKALKRERQEGKRLLFPLRLVPFETLEAWECFDVDAKKDSAREIREYYIPDFSNWKNQDSYQTAFQQLVKDLKS